MDESQTIQPAETAPENGLVNPVRLVVFAVMSVGFLAWVGFGQLEARVWVSGQLTMLDRRISSMWQYLGSNLPDLPASGLISMIYWFSIAVIVVCTIAGFWLFLGTPDDEPQPEPLEHFHAAHLQHESE